MFQNMFPPIDVATMDLKACRRVLLLNYDAEKSLYVTHAFLHCIFVTI
jgi:hypothetical protein